MPEITEAQLREYQRFQQFGTPDEVDGKLKKLETVQGENKEYRGEIKDLKGKLPAEGAVVLIGDDAAKWEKVKGVDVDDLTAKAAKLPELEGELAKRDRETKRRAAAEAEGFDPDALSGIAGSTDLDYETGEVADPKDASKKVKAGFVVIEGKKVRLGEHAAATWPVKLVEAARAVSSTSGGGGGSITFPAERPAGGTGGAKTANDHATAVRGTVDYSI